MKLKLTNEGQLKTFFDKYGVDETGMLDTKQVAKLCVDLGSGNKHPKKFSPVIAFYYRYFFILFYQYPHRARKLL